MGILLDYLEDYQYYNKPEGQDPVGKIVGFGKWGFASGCYISTLDCTMYSKCQNFKQCLNTCAFWIVPMTGMCVTFASVTYLMNSIRKTDDHINYVTGTWATTYIFHCWSKNAKLSMCVGLLMTICAIVKKDTEYYHRQKTLEVNDGQKWLLPWRNRPDRQFLSAPRYKHNKEDYWTNFI